MHRLQELFATAEGEQAFNDALHALFETARLDAAEAVLAAELETMDTEIARMCRELPQGAVVLNGWDHLVEAIELHEGEAIAGVTLAIANELDLAFEKGRLHEPYVTIGLHTEEAYAFSTATPADLIAECRAEAGAAWAGREEDIELYLEVEGFGPLNTALLYHKQRHFFRDDNPLSAPMRYVDYVIGCWWRALRFQQAIASEYARQGVPGSVPVVAGMIEMRPDLVCVHTGEAPATPTERRAETPEMAGISAADFIQRKPVEEEQEPSGTGLRRRFADSEPEPAEVPEKKGLLARFFRRGQQLEEAA
ncbi:MAG TPA: hypothetical protein VI168_01665 [Croceibacterium sp.]